MVLLPWRGPSTGIIFFFGGWVGENWLGMDIDGPGIAYKVYNTTPPKTNTNTQNDGLEMVTPFKYGHVWYPC